MKYVKNNNTEQGKNIITDRDITITGENKNLGNSLSNIIQSHEDSINKLKSNVKWLYKYGGVGSGSGSGNGSSISWGMYITIDGIRAINGETTYLSQDTSYYTITISISGGTSSYKLTGAYQYNEQKANKLNLGTLDSNNSWETSITLNLISNGKLSLTAKDQLTGEIKDFSIDFITTSYIIDPILIYLDNDLSNPILNNIYLSEDRLNKPIRLNINYNTSLPLDRISYVWSVNKISDDPVVITDNMENSNNTTKSGIITKDLNILNYDSIGLHSISCAITLHRPNSTETIEILREVSIYIIPNDLYLLVTSPEPFVKSLSNDELKEKPKTFSRLNRDLNIYITPYNGSDTISNIKVSVEIYNCISINNGNNDDNWELASTIDCGTYTPLNKEPLNSIYLILNEKNLAGWKKIILKGVNNNNTEITTNDRYNTYYIYLDEPGGELTWFKEDVDLISKEQDGKKIITYPNSIYFRKGDIGGFGIPNNITQESFNNFFREKNIYNKLQDNITDEIQLNDIYDSTDISIKENGGDLLISIGIQYSEINQTTNPIISFQDEKTSISNLIYLYQNKVEFKRKSKTGESTENTICTVPIYLEKIKYNEYNQRTNDNFKLLQIFFADPYIEKTDVGLTQQFRKCYVYIDGILEGAAESWFDDKISNIKTIKLFSGNYRINLLEVTHFPSDKIYNVDLCSSYYYNTYKYFNEDISGESTSRDIYLLNKLYIKYEKEEDRLINLDNELLKLKDINIVNSIAKCAGVPTLICDINSTYTFQENSYNIISDWLNNRVFTEQDSDQGQNANTIIEERIPINSLEWYKPPQDINLGEEENISFTKITPQSLWGDKGSNLNFYLRLQGSSTMRFKSKNFTLGVKTNSSSEDEGGSTTTYLFSPNFNIDDKSTFLPEQSFTLKADVVDSSHINNCCLGKFINTVMKKSNDIISSEKYNNHIKTCLTGFPIILILKIDETNDNQESYSNYYYLGIYNFNLGRESYLNLGYVDTNILGNKLDDVRGDGFIGISVDGYKINEKLSVAEIQGNKDVFDFHQYDQTVLFKLQGLSNDIGAMFGDLVYGDDETNTKGYISSFVQSISKAGGYLFSSLGKNFQQIIYDNGTLNTKVAYKLENTVPDYRKQLIRSINSDQKEVFRINETISDSDKNDLIKCIKSSSNSTTNESDPPFLDYTSAVYYYTICMAFGLVDSVQKNLNIKSWNNRTFGIYFYDMDTSFGISNTGTDVSVFCFSDYWDELSEEIDENDPFDSSKKVRKMNGINIKRDFFDENEVETGYDIPSSYLFAIAKYACAFKSDIWSEQEFPIFPQELWATWRYTTERNQDNIEIGILKSGEDFFNSYYKNHLINIPSLLKSLNFRNKYLYNGYGLRYAENKDEETGEITTKGFNTTDITPFNGIRLYKVKDWLNDRFHILDAYFNITGLPTIIYEKDKISEPINTKWEILKNTDIIINNDIFTKSGSTIPSRDGNLNFYIRSSNFSPIIINATTAVYRYLLRNPENTYNISFPTSTQNVKIGGSSEWTKLDSLNSFISTLKSSNELYVNTKRLDELKADADPKKLSGDNSGIKTAALTVPAVKKIYFNNANYNFTMELSDTNYQSLEELDISKSKISLTIKSGSTLSGLKKINLTSVSSNEIILTNLIEDSTEIILNKTYVNTFSSNSWENNLVLNSQKLNATTLTLSTTKSNKTITIENLTKLAVLNLSGFNEITINGCNKLTTINLSGSEKKITIKGCAKLKKLDLKNNKIQLTTLNLDSCTLLDELILNSNVIGQIETLNLNKTSISRIKFFNDTTKLEEEPTTKIINAGSPLLDLTNFNSLNDFSISENNHVEFIKFKNEKGEPFRLTKNFYKCINLKRIFGYTRIDKNTKGCFANCNLFSIHGYFIHENENDGTITNRLYDLDGEPIKFNEESIVDVATGYIKHPKELENALVSAGDEKYLMEFQSTDEDNEGEITNMEAESLNRLSISGDSYSGGTFGKTSVTLFDIYYILQNITTNENNINGAAAFYLSLTEEEKKNTHDDDCRFFSWAENFDNSPNKHLFEDWGNKLSSLSRFFQGRCKKIRIFTENDGEHGLLWNLGKITTFSCFIDGTIYTDNKIFSFKDYNSTNRRKIQPDFLNYITGAGRLILINNYETDGRNNINKYKYEDIFNIETGNLKDDLKDLDENDNFKYLGDFENILNSFELTGAANKNNISYGFSLISYINYDKSYLGLKGVDCIEGIRSSFISTYACGNINLNNIFFLDSDSNKTLNNIKAINYSFRVNNPLIISGKSITATFILDDNTFNILPNNKFTEFGYYTDINSQGDNGNNYNYTSFSGAGITKYWDIDSKNTILSNFVNLETCMGLFSDCTPIKNGNVEDVVEEVITLPDEMFYNNANLMNLQYCFYNFKGKIELTSEGFVNCTKLRNLNSLFNTTRSYTYLGDINNKKGIISHIPYKFFYTGKKDTDETRSIYGINEKLTLSSSWELAVSTNTYQLESENLVYSIKSSDVDENRKIKPTVEITQINKDTNTKQIHIAGSLIELDLENTSLFESKVNILNSSISYESINTPIENLKNCFKNQIHIQKYENKDPEEINNPEYIPYIYYNYGDSSKWLERPNSEVYQLEKIKYWAFDGQQSDDESATILDIKNKQVDSKTYEVSTGSENNLILPIKGYKITTSTTNYSNFMCPPDLFRYCNNVESLDITGIFDSCGFIYNNNTSDSNANAGNYNIYVKYGITGRICPYLLKPISNITKFNNIFKNNKLLSNYFYKNNGIIVESRLIPEDFFSYATKITELNETFYGLIWPAFTRLDNTFNKLSKELILNKTFYQPYYSFKETGENSGIYYPAVVTNVFSKNKILAAKSVFNTGYSGNNFPSNITNDSNFELAPIVIYGNNFSNVSKSIEYDSPKQNYYGYMINTNVSIKLNADDNDIKEYTFDIAFGNCFSNGYTTEFSTNEEINNVRSGAKTDNYWIG